MLISAPPPELKPSTALMQAWEAEESALERGDVDAAVQAVLDAWLLADATAALRDRVASMQRRTFELQAGMGAVEEAPDPVEADPEALGRPAIPALVAAGALDLEDFRLGAEALANRLPEATHAIIAQAGHLAPLEQPEIFRELLLDFLSDPRR
jgi:pimeloyl-ACP methyl ester carboxylesterase